jgi:glutaredoxin-like protein NrdH
MELSLWKTLKASNNLIRNGAKIMITVYTKPACVQCDATKRLLTKHGLSFETIDITEDQLAYDKIISMGFKSAPVVITDNDSWAGFNPDKINGLAA